MVDGECDSDSDNIIESQDIFLSADERYDVWEVKRQERPYLLLDNDKNIDNDDVDKEEEEEDKKEEEEDEANNGNTKDDDEDLPLPLLDGCDIRNWRRHQFVETKSSLDYDYQEGILNVGSGCTLFRRESQLPTVPSSRARQTWKKLQEKFLTPPPVKNMAIRISAKDAKQLLEPSPWFERDNIPVILEGLTEDWNAMESCRWNALVERYGDYQWRFSDTHGATMTLKTYHKYAMTNLEGLTDDAPLAVYDSQLFEYENDDRRALLNDYKVPPCFDGPDLFGMVASETKNDEDKDEDDSDDENENDARPPYRWILMGPERSGTGLHVDPLGTHAWVTLIEGKKRWVLFPREGTDPHEIGMFQDRPQIPSSIWFHTWYDRAMAKYRNAGAIEVLQLPGETVYVPAGWPHLVLNVETSVAITHNYATEYPCFDRFAKAVQTEEPEFYQEWKEKLQKVRTDMEFENEQE